MTRCLLLIQFLFFTLFCTRSIGKNVKTYDVTLIITWDQSLILFDGHEHLPPMAHPGVLTIIYETFLYFFLVILRRKLLYTPKLHFSDIFYTWINVSTWYICCKSDYKSCAYMGATFTSFCIETVEMLNFWTKENSVFFALLLQGIKLYFAS